jgi:hypothetical protein
LQGPNRTRHSDPNVSPIADKFAAHGQCTSTCCHLQYQELCLKEEPESRLTYHAEALLLTDSLNIPRNELCLVSYACQPSSPHKQHVPKEGSISDARINENSLLLCFSFCFAFADSCGL